MLALSEHCRAVVDTATFLTIDRKDEETGYDEKEVKDKDAHTYNDNDRGKDIQIVFKKTHTKAKTKTIRQGQDIRKYNTLQLLSSFQFNRTESLSGPHDISCVRHHWI